MLFRINLGDWGSVFAVPTKVVTEKLKLSSECQLKVLLYILGNNSRAFTNEEIGRALGIHEDDVKDALTYWVNEGILAFSRETIIPADIPADASSEATGNPLTDLSAGEASAADLQKTVSRSAAAENDSLNTAPQGDKKKRAVMSRPQKPSHTMISMLVANDKTLVDLLNAVQAALKKTMSNNETATIVYLYDTCGLPAPVIMMLVEYCIILNKPNARTIERIGVSWADEGIDSVFAAERKITEVRQSGADFKRVASVFGIHIPGTPSAKQLEYANRWVSQWKFSDEMLREAYERCLDTKGEMKFSYIDGILKRWNRENIRTIAEIKGKPATPSAKPLQEKKIGGLSQKPSYDIEELEKQSFFNS